MKALVVRPGLFEIPEKILKSKHSHPTYALLRDSTLWRNALEMNLMESVGARIIANKFIEMGIETDGLELFEFGISITQKGIKTQNSLIKEFLVNNKYDLILISCTGCIEYFATKRFADFCRKIQPEVIIIAGGYHASSDTYEMLKNIKSIDLIVIGDFEPIAEDLVKAIKEKKNLEAIPNLCFNRNGEIYFTERKFFNIDFIKDIPSSHPSPFDKYFPYYICTMLESSRGCIYNKCYFCPESAMRKYYTVKPVDKLMREINYVAALNTRYYKNMDSLRITFADPSWGGSKTWVKDFCEQLSQKKKDFSVQIKWDVSIRPDQDLSELFNSMYQAGCISILIGVESFVPKSLENMNKTLNSEKFIIKAKNLLKAASQFEWMISVPILIGWPGESMKDILETTHKASTLKKELGIDKDIRFLYFFVTPLPGTKLWEIVEDDSYKKKYGFQWIVSKRFWEEGILPLVPLFDPSRTVKASAFSNFGLHYLKSKTDKISIDDHFWEAKNSFDNKIYNQDIITKEEILAEAQSLRNFYNKNITSSII